MISIARSFFRIPIRIAWLVLRLEGISLWCVYGLLFGNSYDAIVDVCSPKQVGIETSLVDFDNSECRGRFLRRTRYARDEEEKLRCIMVRA